MRLIIDIPKETYEFINVYEVMDDDYIGKLAGAITNGTPIPDNATVCDIEQIRTEIENIEPYEYLSEWRLKEDVLQIISKYTKGERK